MQIDLSPMIHINENKPKFNVDGGEIVYLKTQPTSTDNKVNIKWEFEIEERLTEEENMKELIILALNKFIKFVSPSFSLATLRAASFSPIVHHIFAGTEAIPLYCLTEKDQSGKDKLVFETVFTSAF